jgi:O-antigen ligase
LLSPTGWSQGRKKRFDPYVGCEILTGLPFSGTRINSEGSGEESLLTLIGRAFVTSLVALTLSATYVAESTRKAVASSNGWVLFFLITKPLIDLTWRWEFLEFSEQRVNLQAVIGVMIIGFAAIRAWHLRREIGFVRPAVLLLSVSMISVLYSPSSWALNELIRLYSGIAFFFVAGEALRKQMNFDRFALAFVAVVCVPVLLAFMQVAGLVPFDYWDWIDGQEIGRATGTYNMPLSLVYLFVYSIPFTLYLLERGGGWFLRVSLVASLLALGFTYHRTAFIAIAAQLILWLLLKKRFAAVFGLCAAGCLAAVLYAGAIRTLYTPLTSALQGDVDVSSQDFLRGRGIIWTTFLADYAQSGPVGWLIGRGGSVLNRSLLLDEVGENDPHNDFVRLLHDYGIIGMLLYVSLLARLTVTGWKALGGGPFPNAVARMLLVSVVAVLILSFTGEPTRYPSAILYLFSLGSLLFTLKNSPLREHSHA